MPFRIPSTRLLDLDAQRICLIKPSALGDVVQTLPLLGMLRQRFPTATLSWIVRRDLANLITGHPDLTEVIPFHRDGTWRESLQFLGLLKRRRFDLVFDLQGLFRTAVMTFATGAALRVGLETAREGANLACNCIVPNSGRNVPAHRRYWRVAEAVGLADHPRTALIPTTAAESIWLAEQLRHLPRPIMAIHPGAGWVTKRWPVEEFAEIARRFVGSVIVIGAASEQLAGTRIIAATANSPVRQESLSTSGVAELARVREDGNGLNSGEFSYPQESLPRPSFPKPARNLAGQTTLKQLALLLRAVDLLVTNDSGPMHLAAAVETPVVGIFTCTDPVLSGPAGTMHELVSTGVSCAAGYHKTCPHSGSTHQACLAELSVERVWSAVARVLDRRQSTARPA